MIKITWEEFSTYLIIEKKIAESKHSLEALKSRFKLITDFFSDKPFTRDNFNIFIINLKPTASNSYLNALISTSKQIDKFIGKNCIQDFTYFKRMTKPIEVLTPSEMHKIIDCKIRYRKTNKILNLKYKSLFTLLWATGARISEVLNLTWNDLKSDYVVFRNTKTGQDRAVPIENKVFRLIYTIPKTNTLIFTTVNNNQMDGVNVNRELKKRLVKCRIIKSGIHNHTIRHSFATTLIENGMNIEAVAKLLGHANINTTSQYYYHVQLKTLRENILVYHPLYKKDLTFETITKKVNDYVHILLDHSKLNLITKETNNTFTVFIKNV